MKKKDRVAAVLTLRRPGLWNKRGRKAIAAWIRRQADDLERFSADYGPRDLRARYLY